MDIKINNKYRITSDPRNFILHEGETCYYFTSIGALVKGFINKNIRNDVTIKTLKQLQNNIDQYGKEIESVVKKSFTT